MTARAFDRKLEALRALRSASDPVATCEQLRKALTDRNNFLVSKAAALVEELNYIELMPALLEAYERFFIEPERSDPQCLAKTAIVKALHDLGHRSGETYIRGVRHFQFEPALGGRSDTSGALRGACVRALTDCLMEDLEILTYVTDGLGDPDASVRVESAVAIDHLGRREGALLLRLKILSGDPQADVIRQCLMSLLSLEPERSVPFVSRLLRSSDENTQLEAAWALAQCRAPQAIEALERFWQELGISLEVRHALLVSLGASTMPQAAEFLLFVVDSQPADLALSAIIALANSRFRDEVRASVATLVATRDDKKLTLMFEQRFGARPPMKT